MLQVTRLKRAAESTLRQHPEEHTAEWQQPCLQQAPLSAGPADLQGRLEAAIGVLQDGLIERDTEVSSPLCCIKAACSSLLRGSSSLLQPRVTLAASLPGAGPEKCYSPGSRCSPEPSHCRPDRDACTGTCTLDRDDMLRCRCACCCWRRSLESTFCSLGRQAPQELSWADAWLACTRAPSLRGCSPASPSRGASCNLPGCSIGVP